MIVKKITALFAFILFSAFLFAGPGLNLVQNRQSRYRIVIPEHPSVYEEKAAKELQRLLFACSKTTIPILTENKPASPYEIVVGASSRLLSDSSKCRTKSLGEEGFRIFTKNNRLFLLGGTGKGPLYAVYHLLEKYVGFRFYTPKDFMIPARKDVILPVLKEENQVPQIAYRALYYRSDATDEFFRDWHKLTYHQTSDSLPDWGLWVHTFNLLLPPETHYQAHPEYYALVNGKRIPTQPCLAHPEVLEIISTNLAKRMALQPLAKYWSVSQNDNGSYCTCDACKAIDSAEGAPSGSIIRFVNAVAAKFPQKIISTLAYQYSRTAPRHLKPAPNVNIMFCSIECNRSLPIASDPGSASFRKDMTDWTVLTNHILVWDYVVQFKNLVSPFPNLFVLQPNILFFVNHHAKAIFQQGNRERGGEFAALRQYLIAKLLWDPGINADSCITDFLNGYYGAAGQYIGAYINSMQQALTASGKPLEIFGSPLDHFKDGYLRKEMTDRYTSLFRQAMAAVKNQPVFEAHVQEAKLPLDYALLSIATSGMEGSEGFMSTQTDGASIVKPAVLTRLEDFQKRCTHFGVTRLHEWDMTPDEFYQTLQRQFTKTGKKHLAYGKPVQYLTPYDLAYPGAGAKGLTDAVYGNDEFHNAWQGFQKNDLDVMIDLGEQQEMDSINASFLQITDNWIFLPSEVQYYHSSDGIHFTAWSTLQNKVPERTPFVISDFKTIQKTKARYVRIKAKNKGICPNWHGGAGSPCWMFIDEIEIW